MTTIEEPVVLARRPSGHPLAVWEARIAADRGRLEVVLVVQPGAISPVVVPILTSLELRQLLADAPADQAEAWSCPECGHTNPASRAWCAGCSGHSRDVR